MSYRGRYWVNEPDYDRFVRLLEKMEREAFDACAFVNQNKHVSVSYQTPETLRPDLMELIKLARDVFIYESEALQAEIDHADDMEDERDEAIKERDDAEHELSVAQKCLQEITDYVSDLDPDKLKIFEDNYSKISKVMTQYGY